MQKPRPVFQDWLPTTLGAYRLPNYRVEQLVGYGTVYLSERVPGCYIASFPPPKDLPGLVEARLRAYAEADTETDTIWACDEGIDLPLQGEFAGAIPDMSTKPQENDDMTTDLKTVEAAAPE